MRTSFVIVVHTLIFNEAGDLLLLRRANTGFLDGHYAPPGGHRRSGETVLSAAARECREEIGIEVREVVPVVVMPYGGGVDFIFEAKGWRGNPAIGEPDKCDGLVFAAPDALPEPTVPFVAEALACRMDGVWYREFE